MESAEMVIDESDPAVVIISWVMTYWAGKILKDKYESFKHFLPAIAILCAVGARAAISFASEQPVDFPLVIRAFGAGAIAVFSHSQFREIQKMVQEKS